MPKVSIVVPIYNGELYLKECLDSIVNQTLKEIEIICVNDASQDTSLKIISEYAMKDSRIIVINNLDNLGIGHSLNIGFASATGEYIGEIDTITLLKTS